MAARRTAPTDPSGPPRGGGDAARREPSPGQGAAPGAPFRRAWTLRSTHSTSLRGSAARAPPYPKRATLIASTRTLAPFVTVSSPTRRQRRPHRPEDTPMSRIVTVRPPPFSFHRIPSSPVVCEAEVTLAHVKYDRWPERDRTARYSAVATSASGARVRHHSAYTKPTPSRRPPEPPATTASGTPPKEAAAEPATARANSAESWNATVRGAGRRMRVGKADGFGSRRTNGGSPARERPVQPQVRPPSSGRSSGRPRRRARSPRPKGRRG